MLLEDLELLRSIYRAIDWEKLYAERPELVRKSVDELFRRITGLLEGWRGTDGEEAGEPAPRRARPASKAPATDRVTLHCDGSCSGNPGPGGIGVALSSPDGGEIEAWGRFIGRTTNNIAEYRALIAGLERALELGARSIEVFSDSELMVKQVTGSYRVKNANLKALRAQVEGLLGQFSGWTINRIPRAQNKRADALAQAATKERNRSRD